MADNFGVSFSPLARSGGGSGGTAAQPVQEAIRVLSLRVPQVAGARAIAPQPLLNAPGAASVAAPMGTPGAPAVGGLAEILRKRFGLMGPTSPGTVPLPSAAHGGGWLPEGPLAGGASAPPPPMPSPRVIVGVQPGAAPPATPSPFTSAATVAAALRARGGG